MRSAASSARATSSTKSTMPGATRKSASTPCVRRSAQASTSAGRRSPTRAWPNTTSTAGQCRIWSTRTTSALCAKGSMTLQLLLLGDAPVAQLVERARLAEGNGYSAVWVADERFYREVYSCLGQIAVHTSRVLLGPCVTDPFARHPALTAMAIATLDEISGGRAILGIGAGISGFSELGIERRKPARAIREAMEVIRALLRGETVDFHGDVVAFNQGRLSFSPPRPGMPVYVASNGPLGQRVGADIGDGVIMEACASAAEVRAFRAAVARAARNTGRDPRAIPIFARLNTCIAADGRIARD